MFTFMLEETRRAQRLQTLTRPTTRAESHLLNNQNICNMRNRKEQTQRVQSSSETSNTVTDSLLIRWFKEIFLFAKTLKTWCEMFGHDFAAVICIIWTKQKLNCFTTRLSARWMSEGSHTCSQNKVTNLILSLIIQFKFQLGAISSGVFLPECRL